MPYRILYNRTECLIKYYIEHYTVSVLSTYFVTDEERKGGLVVSEK